MKKITLILISYLSPFYPVIFLKNMVMKEFMLLIHNDANSKSTFTPEREKEFLNACKVYIETLKKSDHLVSAQPLVR